MNPILSTLEKICRGYTMKLPTLLRIALATLLVGLIQLVHYLAVSRGYNQDTANKYASMAWSFVGGAFLLNIYSHPIKEEEEKDG